MARVEREVEVVNKFGLHARPAMQFVELANSFASNIEICKGSLDVDGKSIMSVMRLAAGKGTLLKLTAEGDDAEDAIDALASLVDGGFGEMEQGS